jgi:glucose/mannose-6-phosphate isomerase
VTDAGLLDSVGMFDLAAGLPEQVAAAVALGAGAEGLPEHDDVDQVVVLGMGGSGVAGDVLAAVAGPFMPVPVTVAKSHEAPASLGPGSLCFAISYSGDTEETLEAAQAAVTAGARLVALSSGGALAELARVADAPHIRLPDCPMPRAGVGSVFGWIKTTGGLRKTRHRGTARVGWTFTLTAAACNLIRLPKLLEAT